MIWFGIILVFGPLLIATSVAGTILFIKSVQYKTESPRCLRCGYDIRHVPADSRSCSECGEALDSAREGVATNWTMFFIGMLLLATPMVAGLILLLLAF